MKTCARPCAMNYGTGFIRSFMHYRMELRLTMEIAAQKCLMQRVRMREEFVFTEKWQISSSVKQRRTMISGESVMTRIVSRM